jgi:hypothetical protein
MKQIRGEGRQEIGFSREGHGQNIFWLILIKTWFEWFVCNFWIELKMNLIY